MSTTSPTTAASPRTARRTPIYVHIAAWTVPVMVLGQFAMLAVAPVLVLFVASIADARVRALRWYTGLLTALYATPLVIWVLRPDGAPSLSKDIHPVFVGLIVVASALLLAKILTRRR